MFSLSIATKYPESFDNSIPQELVYSGTKTLTEQIEGLGIDAGQLVLSPTRTYAPVIRKILDAKRNKIHGMIHCTGGAQTKVLHFINDNAIIKDNMFAVPPLFKIIKEESNTDWKEMYQVFNMGHRMEIYVSPEDAEDIIQISKSFNIDAQVIGHVEEDNNLRSQLNQSSVFLIINYGRK